MVWALAYTEDERRYLHRLEQHVADFLASPSVLDPKSAARRQEESHDGFLPLRSLPARQVIRRKTLTKEEDAQ